IDKVESLGLSEKTLIIFVPDHGAWRHGKATLYDFGMRVPMLMLWQGTIKAGTQYDQMIANIDIAPTLMELCSIEKPDNYEVDGLSFKQALFGNKDPIREILFGELGHSRAVKTKDWKYIAVRYPKELQARIESGERFAGFKGDTLPAPYLTRNSHLGHYASEANPNYFDANQLYDLRTDPEETVNTYLNNPEVGQRMKRALSKQLKQFKQRPFGEFTD
ncbi:MAG: sulfatase family protein, partial [Opitutales bacterium]